MLILLILGTLSSFYSETNKKILTISDIDNNDVYVYLGTNITNITITIIILMLLLDTGTGFTLQQTLSGTDPDGNFGIIVKVLGKTITNFSDIVNNNATINTGTTMIIVDNGWNDNKGKVYSYTCSGSGSNMCQQAYTLSGSVLL